MIKRALDLLLVCLTLPLWLPVALITASAVWWKMGAPIFFRQPRVGARNSIFVLIKFRTMRNAFTDDGLPLDDAERLTRFGRFLRATSLDEFPSFWNVLSGDMSLVGPRPLLVEYLALYSPRQARRHEVRPGITGWAQVNGRNTLSWEDKLELDVWYVEHRCFALDVRIMALTILKVLLRKDISAPGMATMGRFAGNDDTAPDRPPPGE